MLCILLAPILGALFFWQVPQTHAQQSLSTRPEITYVATKPCSSPSCLSITTVAINGLNFESNARVDALGFFDNRPYGGIIVGRSGTSQILVDFHNLPCFQRYRVVVINSGFKGDSIDTFAPNGCSRTPTLPQTITITAYPHVVVQGESVTLQGIGFWPVASENRVYIAGARMPESLNTVSRDGKVLTFLVTTELQFKDGERDEVWVENRNGRSNSFYIVIKTPKDNRPQLLSVYPNPAVVGNIVILRGSNFGTNPGTVALVTKRSKGEEPPSSRFISSNEIKMWNNQIIAFTLPKSLPVNSDYDVFVLFGKEFRKELGYSDPLPLKIQLRR